MKRNLRRYLNSLLVAGALACSSMLTSCVVSVGDDWQPDYDRYFYDTYLFGVWELWSINGAVVPDNQLNWLEFNSNGRGYYYYYQYGRPMTTPLRYDCRYSSDRYSNTVINIQYYGDAYPTSMYYWFTGDRLTMQWVDRGRVTTYEYIPVDYAPWN